MLAQHSRQRARFGENGEVVLLNRQDRSLWDRDAITEAEQVVHEVLQHSAHRRQPVGRYTLQAAIALEHVRPQTAGETDWGRIAHLRGLLSRVDDVPAQRIAWAVATGRAHGPRQGLTILEGVPNAENSYLFYAARADLLEAAGQLAAAGCAYARATTLAPGDSERAALTEKQALVDERARRTPLSSTT